ncbi:MULTISPECIES: hypothetical protein [unclassified Luteococcus]|uniref:hypothetical protein n=1 Tax=unclassified Luteococcus TaxID=2639923 RepID=UPI00313B3799
MRRPMMLAATALLITLSACSGDDGQTHAQPAGGPASTAPAATATASAGEPSGTASAVPVATPASPATTGATSGDAGAQTGQTTTPVLTTKPSRSAQATGPATATPTGTPAAAGGAGASGGTLYYISVGDGGPLGCGDTAVGAVDLPRSQTPVRDAMTKLLANHSPRLGSSGLENPIGRSSLRYVDGRYDRATGVVSVWLEGTLKQSGTCDDPRLEAQLEMTATSAAGAKTARVFVNGKTLESYFDMSG